MADERIAAAVIAGLLGLGTAGLYLALLDSAALHASGFIVPRARSVMRACRPARAPRALLPCPALRPGLLATAAVLLIAFGALTILSIGMLRLLAGVAALAATDAAVADGGSRGFRSALLGAATGLLLAVVWVTGVV